MLSEKILKLQKIIEYSFDNLEVLIIALTHRSYASQVGQKNCNERMEFLGDSILSAIVAETLYVRYPTESEGKLSQLKAQVVSAPNLSVWSQEINLGDYIFLGKSDDTKESREREGLLCDVFEAIVGAIYLDGGFENAKKFVLKFLNSKKEIVVTDYKSKLQELTQKLYKKFPDYKIIKEFGPDHNKKFEAVVLINSKLLGNGIGNSKKEAHQVAAQKALKNIKSRST
ncbi:MAG: ribonuclease III [Endomicrobium sp.]|jgi:ribonuclease-3|uniref:ribonuclease III n=1 Tax=Candidatus Endomicrobiellum cubanum TaxID=3242325 RepID=UPI0028207D1E|nr:ribonuclease III [Endomicrobium sp.]MDR2395333.1 ribonuclease III [Endomicrobium sp.]